MKNQNYTIRELLEMLENGGLIRENFQRTPSHDDKKALEIIGSITSGRYSGILTLAEIGNSGKLSILDGSSRLQDIQNFVNNSLYKTDTITTTESDGNTTKTIKSKVKMDFQSLTEMEKNTFLDYEFPCIILENTTIEDRVKAFVNVNSSVALSSIQKNKGNISSKLLEIVEIVGSSKIVNHIFTKRLLQKDEATAFTYVLLANVYGCYVATNAKLVDAVNKLDLTDFNLIRLENVLSLFDDIEIDVNKYCILSHIVNLYNSCIDVEGLENFDNRVVYPVVSAGANSVPANDNRLTKSVQILNKVLGVSVKTGKPVKKADSVEVVSLEDIAE